ncbi:Galectin-9 [Halotydeus destructor]|nr:Galectin-9 [Halotydeus destructor]
MYPTIHKPNVPFVAPVPGGVTVGTQIIIEGHVPSWFTERFDINLVFGHNATFEHVRRADIAFHFNPRFEEHAVVINHRSNGDWGPEHREHGHMPVRKGYDFEVQITVEDSYFRVTVNGNHFTNFPHRLPYRDCGLLWIDGRVDLKKIQFAQLGSGGGGSMGYASAPSFQPAPTMSMAYPAAPQFMPQPPNMAYPPAPGPGMGYPSAPGPHYPHGHPNWRPY